MRSNLKNETGSVLIMVLWVLMIITYLSAEYLAHNKEKASYALNSMQSLKRNQAIESVLHLFADNSWPIPGYEIYKNEWIQLSLSGIDLKVKVETEAKRINLNNDQDAKIREKIRAIIEAKLEAKKDLIEIENEDKQEPIMDIEEYDADAITDAILDWRDYDKMVRTNGAEEDFYKKEGSNFLPANGPFKVFTELLLVKGITHDLFWGDPYSSLASDLEGGEEGEEGEGEPDSNILSIDTKNGSIVDAFTIHDKNLKRISIIIENESGSDYFEIIFLKKERNNWKIKERISTILMNNT